MQSQHLQIVFGKKGRANSVYAIPSFHSGKRKVSRSEFTIFQVVALHPDRRSYLQRAFALSTDDSSL